MANPQREIIKVFRKYPLEFTSKIIRLVIDSGVPGSAATKVNFINDYLDALDVFTTNQDLSDLISFYKALPDQGKSLIVNAARGVVQDNYKDVDSDSTSNKNKLVSDLQEIESVSGGYGYGFGIVDDPSFEDLIGG